MTTRRKARPYRPLPPPTASTADDLGKSQVSPDIYLGDIRRDFCILPSAPKRARVGARQQAQMPRRDGP